MQRGRVWPAGWRAGSRLESALAQLFEPSKRLGHTQSEIPGRDPRLWPALVLTRCFIDQLGGCIKVRSRQGQGRVFSLVLPAA